MLAYAAVTFAIAVLSEGDVRPEQPTSAPTELYFLLRAHDKHFRLDLRDARSRLSA